MNNKESNNNPPQKTDAPENMNIKQDVSDFISPEPFLPPDLDSTMLKVQNTHTPMTQKNYQLQDNQKLTAKQEQDLIRYNHISYLLYLLSFFTAGLTWIIPVFMNYYKRREAEGTWLATHFDWQLKTFWYQFIMLVFAIFIGFFAVGSGFGWLVTLFNDGVSTTLGIGAVLLLVLAGVIILVAYVWHLFRIVKGWIALSDGRAV